MADFATFPCPKCGKKMWDNRQTKTNPKQPDYKCTNKECAHPIWPAKGEIVAEMHEDEQSMRPAPPKPTQKAGVDWDAISRGKVRHGVAVAFIEQGRTLDNDTKMEMEGWVEYIMKDK